MKNYTITVNGNVYEVSVEEGTSSAATVSAPKAAAPKAPVKPAAKSTGAQGGIKISAPMPGKVVSVKANVGQAVKKGEVILVFEAMKMENELVATDNGTVASINYAVGDQFESGAVVATLN